MGRFIRADFYCKKAVSIFWNPLFFLESYKVNVVYDGIHEHNIDQLKMIGICDSRDINSFEDCRKNPPVIKVTTARARKLKP